MAWPKGQPRRPRQTDNSGKAAEEAVEVGVVGDAETVNLDDLFDQGVETAEGEAEANGTISELRNDEEVRRELAERERKAEQPGVIERVAAAVTHVIRGSADTMDQIDIFARCERASEAALMAGRDGHAMHVLTVAIANVKGALPAAIAVADQDIRPTLEWLRGRL